MEIRFNFLKHGRFEFLQITADDEEFLSYFRKFLRKISAPPVRRDKKNGVYVGRYTKKQMIEITCWVADTTFHKQNWRKKVPK